MSMARQYHFSNGSWQASGKISNDHKACIFSEKIQSTDQTIIEGTQGTGKIPANRYAAVPSILSNHFLPQGLDDRTFSLVAFDARERHPDAQTHPVGRHTLVLWSSLP
jgi:hypothetical protein